MAAAAVQPPSLPGPPGQPDIAYAPNYENYLARIKRRQEQERLNKTLPDGFPQRLESKLVWDGKTLAEHYNWNCVLTEDDQKEIDEALNHFKYPPRDLGLDPQRPWVQGRPRGARRQVKPGGERHHLRCVSSHVAPVDGRQDNQFQGQPADVVLAHIKDLTKVVDAHRIGAPAYTTEKQVFHTDAGDVIALFALGEAAEGGQSYLSSSWHVYNELSRTRPDMIRTLAEPWDADEFGKDGRAYSSRPLLHHQPAADGKPERLIIQYARRVFTGYWGLPRSADIPPITEAQAEALDALHFLAEKSAASLDFHKGDIQYADNLSIFLARGGFVELNSDDKQRHLIRLWLRDPQNAWETPEALRDRWDRVYSGVTPQKSVFSLEAQIRSASRGESKPEENASSAS